MKKKINKRRWGEGKGSEWERGGKHEIKEGKLELRIKLKQETKLGKAK